MSQYTAGAAGLLTPIVHFLSDPAVSELLVNCAGEIWVEKDGNLACHPLPEFTPAHLSRLFQLIANENRQRLDVAHPLFSGSLPDGSRVQLVLPPTAKDFAMSVRRQVAKNFTLNDYRKQDFYSDAQRATLKENAIEQLPDTEKQLINDYATGDWNTFIQRAVALRKNIVISGGTSSGKTTYLNACLHEINHNDRIILLEDTRELTIPHPNQVSLLAAKGEQGEAKVTMQDLVQCCLRLRPDRIIMGEIRGREMMDFVSACSTGHEGSITSIHANNPRIAFMRMTQMYKLNNVPSMSDEDILNELHAVIDIVIQIAKTPTGRKVQSVYYRYGDLAESRVVKPKRTSFSKHQSTRAVA